MTVKRQQQRSPEQATKQVSLDLPTWQFDVLERYVSSKSTNCLAPKTVKQLLERNTDDWVRHQPRSVSGAASSPSVLPTCSSQDTPSKVGKKLEPRPEQRTNGCIVIKFIRCGKPGCPKCQNGKLHGPYKYAVGRIGGKQVWKYLGRASKTSNFLPTGNMESASQQVGKKSNNTRNKVLECIKSNSPCYPGFTDASLGLTT